MSGSPPTDSVTARDDDSEVNPPDHDGRGQQNGGGRMTMAAVKAYMQRNWVEMLLVVVGFLALAIVLTWPVLLHMSTVIPSPGYAWDPAGGIWEFWERANWGLPLWGDWGTQLVGMPFGRIAPAVVTTTQLFEYAPGVLITMIAGPVVAYNVLTLVGLACAGVATYALLRWLGCSAAVAAWAGGAFAMCPYILGKAINHLSLAQIACFPVAILAALWWSERASWRRALVVTATLVFAWITTPYNGLMVMVVLAVVCGGGAIRIWRAHGPAVAAKAVAWVGGLAVLCVGVPVWVLGKSASMGTAPPDLNRPIADLDYFGARITDFVTPSANSVLMKGLNPGWTGVNTIIDERTILYVGISVIALAIVGAITTWRSPNPRLRLAARTAAVLVPVLAWFSLASPTTWLGIHIPVPSLWIWEVAPQFRTFARFGAPLMCALLILGALGLRWLVGLGGKRWKVTVIAIVAFITVLDLSSGIPVPTSTPVPSMVPGRALADTPTWRWLADEPTPGGVITYPTDRFFYRQYLSHADETLYGQIIHGRPMVNGVMSANEVAYDFTQSVSDPTQPGVAKTLATAGVRFAIVDPLGYMRIGVPLNVDVSNPPAGFATEVVFPDGTAVWRVTAQPGPGIVVFRPPGFQTGVGTGPATWNPLVQSPATIAIWARTQGTYRITFPVRGVAPQRITCSVADGTPPTVTRTANSLTLTLDAGVTAREVKMTVSGGVPSGAAVGSPIMKAVP
jgi:hypothetical protein